MHRCLLLILTFAISFQSHGQERVLVADQTFKVEGVHEYYYAFAEGDLIELEVGLLAGNRLKKVAFLALPDLVIYSNYDLDTVVVVRVRASFTGVYLLRITEQGIGKKVCHFAIHRTALGPSTAKMDTRVSWDIKNQGQWTVEKRHLEAGKKAESFSLSGRVAVPAVKIGLVSNRVAYRFELPPNTTRWAYRVGVSQLAKESQRKDAEAFADLTKKGAMKLMAFQPQTALAAYAMGVAIQVTTSTSGEDIEYALVDAANLERFMRGENQYDAYIWQGSVSVDAQRRQQPLAGGYAFVLKNNNLIDNVDVMVEIEAIIETPVFEEEIFLAPR